MRSISDNPTGAAKCSYLIIKINFTTVMLEVKGRKRHISFHMYHNLTH